MAPIGRVGLVPWVLASCGCASCVATQPQACGTSQGPSCGAGFSAPRDPQAVSSKGYCITSEGARADREGDLLQHPSPPRSVLPVISPPAASPRRAIMSGRCDSSWTRDEASAGGEPAGSLHTNREAPIPADKFNRSELARCAMRTSHSVLLSCPHDGPATKMGGVDISGFFFWSEREDSNLRPPAPEAGALPDCATLRPWAGGYPVSPALARGLRPDRRPFRNASASLRCGGRSRSPSASGFPARGGSG